MPLMDWITGLAGNPYFSAGAGLVGVGTFLAIARKGSQWGYFLAHQKYIVSIEIPSRDKSYSWFLRWMSKNATKTQQLSVETRYFRHDNGQVDTHVDFIPSVGNHYFKYRGNWMKVERSREKNMMDIASGMPWESVTITTLGHNKQTMVDLLQEAKELALKEEEGKTIIYTSFGSEWRPFGEPRRRRPLHSVVLPNGVAEKILQDIKNFISNPKWYIDKGVPYRRGYLLYGTPGSGKSSFIQALAGELGYNICILSLSDRSLTDDRLNYLLTVAPYKSIILLEDIDAAFSDTKERHMSSQYQNFVSFSGLLNALDGVASAEGRILFMTTNHMEKLDEALIRPGRVDIKEHLGHATRSQIQKLFQKFYPDANEAIAKQFANQVPDNTISMAHLQEFFLHYKDNIEGAGKNIQNWAKNTIAARTSPPK